MESPDLLHPLQLQILSSLMRADSAQRYSDLAIPGVENDLFNYHLQILVKKNYVRKDDSGYALAPLGKEVINKLDALGNPREFFKVSVALAVFRNNHTEMLFQERRRNPFYGDITGIAGKVQRGEKIVDAARRKLQEEAGLGGQFTFVGVLRKIKRNPNNEIVEDTFYHYCIAEDPVGVLVPENEFGRNFWAPAVSILTYEAANIDKAEDDIAVWTKLLNKDYSPFYLEEDFVLTSY